MRVVGAVLCFAVGCGFSPSLTDGGTQPHDGSAQNPDGDMGSGSDVDLCYGKGMLRVCFTSALPPTYAPPANVTIDTGASANCTMVFTQPSGRDLCVIGAQSVTIAMTLRAYGNRPLVVIAAGEFQLTGSIDVSSHDGTNQGAGGNDSDCIAPNVPEGDTGGGGGGAGGSFFGKGGDGGVGDGNDNSGGDGTANPGHATANVTPTIVRGGCKGGVAGGSSPGQLGNVGGNGGGAVYLIAGTHLVLGGTVDASGAGGQVSDTLQGGAGAGAGGMIGLDAPMIDFTGGIFANGGGGGEGGSNGQNGNGGNAGQNGQLSTTAAAQGGSGGTDDAGHGGNGSIGTTHDGSAGAVFDGGGGGGGGGAGFLYSFGAFLTATGQQSPS